MCNDHSELNHYFAEYPKSKLKLGIIKTQINGKVFKFLTSSGVFSKKQIDTGTRLLIEASIIPKKGYVLDLGCGYGAVGIAIAILNPDLKIFMIDLNKRAIWLTKKNIKMNNVNNVEIRTGQLYEPVKDLKFNSILSNPPISAGMDIVKKIIIESPNYLLKKGTFQMVVRSKIGKKTLFKILEVTFGNVEVLIRKSGYRVFIAKKN
jgi:16S rRNA G1207 methylase RsmC